MDSPHSLSIQILLVTHVAHKTAAALSRRVNTRAIATTGLMLYVAAGAGCFFVDDIFTLLLMRAILGISVGLIMPLSTGLFGDDITGPYKAGCLLSIVFLLQVWATRHFQSLPPQKD